MKKLLGVMLGVLLIGSFAVTKAHAFTLDDLMSQIATLRTEVAQLKGNLGGQVLGVAVDGTMSSDYKGSTGTTAVAPTSVLPTMPSTGATVNPPADPSFAPGVGYWVRTENGSCVWTLKKPANTITCAGSESFGSTTTQSEESRSNSSGYWILSGANCIWVKTQPYGARPCQVSQSLGNTNTTTIVRTLSYGDAKSVDVVNLQVALKNAGFLTATPNGTFGPATRTAVMAVQRAKGLPVTGVADQKTIASIDVKDGVTTVSTNTGTVNTDKFISDLPKIIAHYQSILQNPEAFKATATPVAIQQTTTGSARHIAAINYNNCYAVSGGYGSHIFVCE